jgi:Zn-dependent protease with chaperone function
MISLHVSTKKPAKLPGSVVRRMHLIYSMKGGFYMHKYAVFPVVALLLLTTGHTALAVGRTPSRPAASIPHLGQEEISMGNEAAADIEKARPLINDAEINARLERIGNAIAAIANNQEIPASYGNSSITPFTYSFKAIDSTDINAFSLPGGHIYVNKGLLDFCETDHELAAVLAHEVAHAAHHHMVYLLREQSKLDGKMAMIMVAGVLSDVRSDDMSNVLMGAQMYRTAKISGYGQKAEQDADLAAISYMIEAKFNPVGMLTFLERLAERPEVIDWGILQTHPYTSERVKSVKTALKDLEIKIDRRAVTTSFTATVQPVESGNKGYDVLIGKRFICNIKQNDRAKETAERINSILDKGLQFKDLKVVGSNVMARNEVIIELTDEDSDLSNKPTAQLASEANQALYHVLFKQMVNDLW